MNLITKVLILSVVMTNIGTNIFGQDINGRWTGNYSKKLFMTRPKILIVNLDIYNDSLVTGTTHLKYQGSDFEHYTVSGIYNIEDSTISFTEDSTLGVKLSFGASTCLGRYAMKLKVTDTSYRLEGTWTDKSSSLLGCGKSGVWLQRKLDSTTMKTIRQQNDKNLQRETRTTSLIELDVDEQDSIKVEIWDNTKIDNDRISFYVNEAKVIDNHVITKERITFFVPLPDIASKIYRLRLIAESMGSTPPCTAHVLITTTKNKKYELDLTSTMGTNAAIELFAK